MEQGEGREWRPPSHPFGIPGGRRHRNAALRCPRVASSGTAAGKPEPTLPRAAFGGGPSPIWTPLDPLPSCSPLTLAGVLSGAKGNPSKRASKDGKTKAPPPVSSLQDGRQSLIGLPLRRTTLTRGQVENKAGRWHISGFQLQGLWSGDRQRFRKMFKSVSFINSDLPSR